MQIDATGWFEHHFQQGEAFGHIRQISQHSGRAEAFNRSSNGFLRWMIVVLADLVGPLLRFIAPLPHINKGGFLRRRAIGEVGFALPEEDVVVGFGVPRRVEVNQIGQRGSQLVEAFVPLYPLFQVFQAVSKIDRPRFHCRLFWRHLFVFISRIEKNAMRRPQRGTF